MKAYEIVINNKEYLETVKKIENIKFITDGKWDWEHGLGHYKRVSEYTGKILEQLGADSRTIELGMVAGLLHDLGLSESGVNKIDHGIISSKIFRKYLVNTDITENEMDILEHAIKNHSKGNDIKTLIDLALVLGDKLDVTYHRTINSSIQDKINIEIQKIKSVDIDITDNDLIVNYVTDDNFDLSVLREWNKAITIPIKMAKYLKKNFKFLINNKCADYTCVIK